MREPHGYQRKYFTNDEEQATFLQSFSGLLITQSYLYPLLFSVFAVIFLLKDKYQNHSDQSGLKLSARAFSKIINSP